MIGEFFESPFRGDLTRARTLADSTANGVRITTLEVTLPRPYLAEFNTHTLFSRNSASSRAIPTEKNIEAVRDHPYVPTTFNKRVKGMGVGEELDESDQEDCRDTWLHAAFQAVIAAKALNEIGIDKSRANRLLEPFNWQTIIVTATDWANFFALRAPHGDEVDPEFPAQMEMQQAAIVMRQAMRASEPQALEPGWWHLPLVTDEELALMCAERANNTPEQNEQMSRVWCMISSRRCAAVSYNKHADGEPADIAIGKANQLASSGHFSPFQHVARPIDYSDLAFESKRKAKIHVPMDEVMGAMMAAGSSFIENINLGRCWAGNYRGWWPFRKDFLFEDDHSAFLDYEVM